MKPTPMLSVACAGLLLSALALVKTTSIAEAAKVEQSAKSKECSTQADAKGLHGKARKAFRSKCKRDKAA
jgi:hypothetical protein